MSVRAKIKVQIRDRHGNWKAAEGIYPKEWICAHPDCNKVTTTTQRRKHPQKTRDTGTHCSKQCRMKHESLLGLCFKGKGDKQNGI